MGSGVAKSETRDLPVFTRIESSGSADITVMVDGTAGKQEFTIEGDDNILPVIDIEVKDDKLVISSRESYRTRTPIKITITLAALNEARIGGSGSIVANGVAAKDFGVHIAGSGDIKISGQAEKLTASIAGSGDIDTTKMPVDAADVTVTGSGEVKVNATKSIRAQITGSGDIRFAGNPPEVHSTVTGSGNVKRM